MTKCKVCHRKLTNLKSVARGMGARCFKKFNSGHAGVQSDFRYEC